MVEVDAETSITGENSNSNVSNSCSDPFYISSSDQTKNKLVVVCLNSNDIFVAWKKKIMGALVAKVFLTVQFHNLNCLIKITINREDRIIW